MRNEIFRRDQLKAVLLAEPLLFDDICYFWISFRQIGHMEKGSLQSGNTFFPALANALNRYTVDGLFYDFAPKERVYGGPDYLRAPYCRVK